MQLRSLCSWVTCLSLKVNAAEKTRPLSQYTFGHEKCTTRTQFETFTWENPEIWSFKSCFKNHIFNRGALNTPLCIRTSKAVIFSSTLRVSSSNVLKTFLNTIVSIGGIKSSLFIIIAYLPARRTVIIVTKNFVHAQRNRRCCTDEH